MHTFKIAMATDYYLAMADRILGNMATSTDYIWGLQVNTLSHVCGAALALNCVLFEALLYRDMLLSRRKQLTSLPFQYASILTGLLCCIRMITFIHSFHWHVQKSTIPCRSQELLPFFSVMYFFLPPFSTNYSSILSHLILLSLSWSTSQSCCFQIQKLFWEFYFLPFSVHVQTNVIYLTLLYLLE